MNKIILLTASVLLYIYFSELFVHWYNTQSSGFLYFSSFLPSQHRLLYLFMLAATLILPQFFWVKKFRRSPGLSFMLLFIMNAGMFLERFFIVIGSAENSLFSSAVTTYKPSIWVFGIIAGNAGLFLTLYLLLFRFIPFISSYENFNDRKCDE